uniref:Putative tubby C-terminal-like domain-containing protein n=1 Tax=Helianthus annuus TaxID=4232 RepID=A0A251SZ73_HELAN
MIVCVLQQQPCTRILLLIKPHFSTSGHPAQCLYSRCKDISCSAFKYPFISTQIINIITLRTPTSHDSQKFHYYFSFIWLSQLKIFQLKNSQNSFKNHLFTFKYISNRLYFVKFQAFSLHNRWNVFKGESVSDSDMIFTAKTETMKFKANVIMMLANKMRSKDVCDLRIKGSWSMGNITIYKGDSSTVVAQMHKPQDTKYAANKFTATIQPNMDYACVVALFAIVEYEENPTLIGAAAKIKSYENTIDTVGISLPKNKFIYVSLLTILLSHS